MRGASLAETNALVAVLEQKSFTKAAKLLGLSTPRVSDMVRNLEERLGVRLVERTTRSVAPTAAGERLLERLRPVLDEYQAALDSTNEFRGKPAGMLRLTAVPPGTEIVVNGFQAKNGTASLNGSDVTFPDGRKLFVGSSGTGAPYDKRQ